MFSSPCVTSASPAVYFIFWNKEIGLHRARDPFPGAKHGALDVKIWARPLCCPGCHEESSSVYRRIRSLSIRHLPDPPLVGSALSNTLIKPQISFPPLSTVNRRILKFRGGRMIRGATIKTPSCRRLFNETESAFIAASSHRLFGLTSWDWLEVLYPLPRNPRNTKNTIRVL